MKKKISYIAILGGLIGFIFLGLPDSILYAKTGITRFLPIVLIFLGIPALLYLTAIQFVRQKKIGLLISISSIILLGPTFGIWTGYLSEKDLKVNGVKIRGVIVEKSYIKPPRKQGEWRVICKFDINNHEYQTFSQTDKQNIYTVGDTVNILYSKRNPENNKVLELE